MELNEISEKITGCAIKFHKALGPGLLESTYEVCLIHELNKAGLNVQSQVALPVICEGIKLDAGYRIDLLIENAVIVELKAIDNLLPIHEAQILSYLKLSGKKLGLLINFNVKLLINGVRRLVS